MWVAARVEPRVAGCKSVALTTEPWLQLLPVICRGVISDSVLVNPGIDLGCRPHTVHRERISIFDFSQNCELQFRSRNTFSIDKFRMQKILVNRQN